MKKFKKQYLVVPALALTLFAGAGIASAQSATGAPATANKMMQRGEMRGPGGHGGFGGDFANNPEQWLSRITSDAAILGISVDEMKTAWSQGKTLEDLATEKGLTRDQLAEKLKAAAETKQKETLQALVTKGYITQAQADARLNAMKTRQAEMETKRAEMKAKAPTRAKTAPTTNS